MESFYNEYQPVIGLEIHCQLATKSKIFCACSTSFGATPNSHTCPVCLALPGALPVLNSKVLEYAVMAAVAMGSSIQERSIFARKNYFYPDLPKGYQISQYEHPYALGGLVEIETTNGIRTVPLTRIHIEEDAGKSIHDGYGHSLVDLNRAGTPLIEIVSMPEIYSPEEAMAYMKAVYSIVTQIGICDGNMEQGNFRCDANVSVRKKTSTVLGTRVEIKNLNSFRFLGKAIQYEIDRQITALESKEEIRQQTRLWDQDQGKTIVMRDKENAHDYRYFPDPDLLPLIIRKEFIEKLSIPELPRKKLSRYVSLYGLSTDSANILATDKEISNYFEAVISHDISPMLATNWIITTLLGSLNKDASLIQDCKIPPINLSILLKKLESSEINSTIAKQIFDEMYQTGEAPDSVIERKGFKQVNDSKIIENIIDTVILNHQKEVSDYKSGKEKVFSFFVGKVMRETKGQATPSLVNDLLKQKLSS